MNMRTLFKSLFFITLTLCTTTVNSQQVTDHYESAYNTLSEMLEKESVPNLKKAIYTVENAYFEDKLNEQGFSNLIAQLAHTCKILGSTNLITYPQSDFDSVNTHASIFKVMKDTIPFYLNDSTLVYHLPFQYNFDDYTGSKDWSNMFVSTLLASRKGNCHSLPLLYKLIAEEVGEKAWLSLAPNHFYIKLFNKQNRWYNVELTSGGFPTDAWIKASGYVHLDAIKNGIYMDTLSLKQTIAVCLTDLAQGYQRKYPDSYDPGFILKCCDSTLKVFPHYINALLLKVEILNHIYENAESKKEEYYQEITELLSHIHHLGYRKMPEEMYMKWLMSTE